MFYELWILFNFIIGFLEWVLKSSNVILGECEQDGLEIVFCNVYYLLFLINDILDLFKVEFGYMNVNFELLDVR